MLRYSTMRDCYQVGKALMLGMAMVCTAMVIFGIFEEFTWEILTLIYALSFIGQVSERILVRIIYDSISFSGNSKKALIYGAMDGAISIAHTIRSMHTSEYSIVGFISVKGEKKGAYIKTKS